MLQHVTAGYCKPRDVLDASTMCRTKGITVCLGVQASQQLPNTAAVETAVSTRWIRSPNDKSCAPCEIAILTSSSVKPPSGPTKKSNRLTLSLHACSFAFAMLYDS